MVKRDVVKHGAIKLHNVVPTVIVIIEKLHGNAAEQDRFVANPRSKRFVVESPVLIVVVEAIQFKVKMGDVHILPAIAVYVGSIDTHARLVTSVLASSQAGQERHILKCSVVLVEKKEIRP